MHSIAAGISACRSASAGLLLGLSIPPLFLAHAINVRLGTVQQTAIRGFSPISGSLHLIPSRAWFSKPGSPRDLRTVAPDAGKILLRNVYGWFERTQRGVYQLTADGEAALRRWPDASMAHASNARALPDTLAFSQGEISAA
jgi:hypothetical protein